MAGVKVDGDLSQISDIQLQYIKSVIEQRVYTNIKISVVPVGKAGDNYVANVKRIIVEDDNGDTFKMVAKIAPAQVALRNLGNTEMLFRNETIMYTKVLPKMTQIEISADVPPEKRLRYAACYGSSDAVPHEVILLEDLNESNFIMLDKLKPISTDCVKSVLKNFALLHSLSYALKYKEPELFEEYKNSLFDAWEFMGREEMLVYFKQNENICIKQVDSDYYKKALDGAVINSMKNLVKMAKHEKNSKHAIIQQGDAWTNNILFKYDGDTLLKSVMIDYQLSKATSPVADILYMIFNCTDHEMRKEHFYNWIDYYYSELDKSLSNYDLKANFVYPRDQLDADLMRFGKVYFGLSVMQAIALSMNSEEAVELMKNLQEDGGMEKIFDAENYCIKDPESLAIFKTRLEGLVDSSYEFGFI